MIYYRIISELETHKLEIKTCKIKLETGDRENLWYVIDGIHYFPSFELKLLSFS